MAGVTSKLLMGAIKSGAFTMALGATLATDHSALADRVLRHAPSVAPTTVALAHIDDTLDTEEIDFKEAITFVRGTDKKKTTLTTVVESDSTNMDTEVFISISRISPSDIEIRGALETIATRPAILDHIVPRKIYQDPTRLTALLDAVRAIVSDQELINATCARIRAQNEAQVTSSNNNSCAALNYEEVSGTTTPPSSLDAALKQWEDIRAKYPCVICQDVLSAPCILNCSHSFCGRCVNELMGACVHVQDEGTDNSSSSDVSVVYACPCCKTELTNTTFERILDEDISRLVSLVADCPPKEAWAERREFAMKKMRKAATALQRGRVNNNNGDSSNINAGNDNDNDEESSWGELVAEWAPPLAFLVLVLIVVCRNR